MFFSGIIIKLWKIETVLQYAKIVFLLLRARYHTMRVCIVIPNDPDLMYVCSVLLRQLTCMLLCLALQTLLLSDKIINNSIRICALEV